MKLRQGEIKKTMKGILAGAFLLAAGSAAVFAVGTETELKAYAAEWQQAENGDWTYKEDDGSLASGWQMCIRDRSSTCTSRKELWL